MSEKGGKRMKRIPTVRRDRTKDSAVSLDSLVQNATQQTGGGLESDLEKEKIALQKVQRLNERIMKQLEESAIHSATLEAEYRVKERTFKDKEAALEKELQKLRSEIEREKEIFRNDQQKAREKIDYKENVLQEKLDKRLKEHEKEIKMLQIDIEEAQKKAGDIAKAQQLESLIRKETDEKNLTEVNNRKLQNQLEQVQSQLEKEKQNVEQLKEVIEELEKSNTDIKEIVQEKEKFQAEYSELLKLTQELEKEEENNKDNSDTLLRLKNSLRSLKNKNDQLVSQREYLEKNLIRVKAGLDAENEGARVTSRDNSSVSRLDVIDRTPAFQKRGKSRERTSYSNADTAKDRNDEKKLFQLKQQIKTLKRDNERELEKLDKELGSAEVAANKAEANLKKIEQAQKDVQKLIKQEREMSQCRLTVLKEQHTFLVDRNDALSAELKKETKFYQDGEFNLSSVKKELEETQKILNTKKEFLSQLDLQITQKSRVFERAEKELKTELKQYQDTRDKLGDTEASLALVLQNLEQTHREFAETKKDMELEIHTTEAELYDQTEEREIVMKINAELNKEIADLHWYFKPLRDKGEKETKWYSTTEFDFVMDRRAKRKKDLEEIKAEIERTSLDHLQKAQESEDFKKALDRALLKINDQDLRGDILFELKDLTEAMRLALFKQRTILQIVAMIAEQEVYPGAIRELALITKDIKNQHVMQRPEMLLKSTFREWTLDQSKSFRRRLLEKLIYMRMKRTAKSFEQCEDFIFYGEERDVDEIEAEKAEIGDENQ